MKMTMLAVAVVMISSAYGAEVQESRDIALPAPRMAGGKPLLQALKERQTTRAFSPQKLPPQLLADLLWAANGINRPDSGKRTTPSTMNWQEISLYVILADGAYLYDAKANRLQAVAKADLRKLTGTQDFVPSAPLNLVYVADTTKMQGVPSEDQNLYAGADTGFISQNVYLFCASEGLVTVVRGLIGDKKALAEALHLAAGQKIILAQTVGYPATGK